MLWIWYLSAYLRTQDVISFLFSISFWLLGFNNNSSDPLNSCGNMGYIFLMCVVCTQPSFLTWLVFMYELSNFPSSKYYIYTYYWYNIFLVHQVVNRHPQYRSTDTRNTSLGRILQKISCVLLNSAILGLDWYI